MLRASSLVLLLGCMSDGINRPPTVDTAEGIAVCYYSDGLVSKDTVLRWVDMRARELVANKDAWGLGAFADATIWWAIRSEPIIIYPIHSLPNGKIGFNHYGRRIDASLDWPPLYPTINYDPAVRPPVLDGDGTVIGLAVLPHEFKHSLLGDWHP